VLLVTLLAAIAAPAVLGSLGFRSGAFKPKPAKLNPLTGVKRIFGLQGLIELGKSIVKVLLMGAVGFWLIWHSLNTVIGAGRMGLEPALAELGGTFVLACIAMAGVLCLVAGMDVPMQIFQRGKRLNMTKQEVKDENKESEGSPEVKGHLRRKQYETMNASTRKAVSEASVILTNPTHFAVALRYHPGKDFAPVVVARGCDAIAQAIRELADDKAIPVLQYPELTRAIYFTSRVGQVVDEALYMAVATVLAFVFRVENRIATEMDRPFIDVPDDMRFDANGAKKAA
jgi:flagellar biosynthetic protein FlhB